MSLTTGHVVSSTRGLLFRALRSRAHPPTTAVAPPVRAASLTTAAPQRAAVVASGSLPGSLTGSGCSFRASPSYPSSLASIASTARRRSTIIPQAATADARVAEETDVEMPKNPKRAKRTRRMPNARRRTAGAGRAWPARRISRWRAGTVTGIRGRA